MFHYIVGAFRGKVVLKMKFYKVISLIVAMMLCLLSYPMHSVQATSMLLDVQDNTSDVSFVLDRSDFVSEEKYQEYLSENSSRIESNNARTIMYQPETTTTGTLEYTITGLQTSLPIQNFYIGASYIYVTQMTSLDSDDINDDVYISRCLINEETNTATYINHMILRNFGHNQILEAFIRNNKLYLWIGCKSYAGEGMTEQEIAQTGIHPYTIQVGRIEYQPDAIINNYTNITRLSNLNWANSTHTSFGYVKRVDAALSSDKKRIIFAVRNHNNDLQYSCFNVEQLNQLLDAKENATSKYVSFRELDLSEYCIFSCVQTSANKILPQYSCQGIDLTDVYNSIYIAGGLQHQDTYTYQGQSYNYVPQIYKLVLQNNQYVYQSGVTIWNNEFGAMTEIEGVHIVGGNLCFAISGYATRTTTQYIYSIPKSVF